MSIAQKVMKYTKGGVSVCMLVVLALASLFGVLLSTATPAQADTGGDPSGGGSGGGSGNVGCPGCGTGTGGGGGFIGGYPGYTNGVGGWQPAGGGAERVRPGEWSYPPSPLGTYNNPNFWVSARGMSSPDLNVQLWREAGRPCATGYNIGVADPAPGERRDSTVHVLWPWVPSNVGLGLKHVGLYWNETRYWNRNSSALVNKTMSYPGCVTPPPPTILWRDCPVSINSFYMKGPWGYLVKPPSTPPSGVTETREESAMVTHFANVPQPASQADMQPNTWWYTDNGGRLPYNTAPIKVDASTNPWDLWASAEYQSQPQKQFAANYALMQHGKVWALPFIYSNGMAWNMIQNCGSLWAASGYAKPPGTNYSTVGNYVVKTEFYRVRCQMAYYPGLNTQVSQTHYQGGYVGLLPVSWSGELVDYGRGWYGCNTVAYLDQKVSRPFSFSNVCATKDPAQRELYEQGALTYNKPEPYNTTVNFHNRWWRLDPADAMGSAPAGDCLPPPTVTRTTGFCVFDPPDPPATITKTDGVSTNNAIVSADGTPVTLTWNGATPIYVNEDGTPLTPEQKARKVKDERTKLTYNIDEQPFGPSITADTPPEKMPFVATPPYSLPATPGEPGIRPATVTMKFYRGTAPDAAGESKKFSPKLLYTFQYLTEEERTVARIVDNELVIDRIIVEEWQESACPELTANLTVTETRPGN